MTLRTVIGGLVVLVSFGVLVGLGVWQVHRLQWKQAMLHDIAVQVSRPPVDFDKRDIRLGEFQHVGTIGRIVSREPLFLYGRTMDGVAGVHVLCIIETSGKERVLLDRGFLPLPVDQKRANAPLLGVEGLTRVSGGQTWFVPDNDAAKNQWFWIDFKAMEQAAGAGDLIWDEVYIEALKPTAADGPVPTAHRLLDNIPNNHLQYAVTWFGLASVLIVMYGVRVVRQVKA